MQRIIESIDKDIEKHRSDAGSMLGFIGAATAIIIIALFITIAPEIADRFIPSLEKSVTERAEYIKAEKEVFKAKYSKEYYYLSKDDFEDLEDEGLVKDIDQSARRISRLNKGPVILLDTARIVSKMSIANEKSDLIFKALPILFIVVFAGSLFTYRFHMQIVKELSLKRTDMLIKNYGEKSSSNPINSDS